MQTKSVVMIALSAFALGMLCVLPFTTGSENEYAESTFKRASIVRRLDQASRVTEVQEPIRGTRTRELVRELAKSLQ